MSELVFGASSCWIVLFGTGPIPVDLVISELIHVELVNFFWLNFLTTEK